MKILVTGGTGFISRHITDLLQKKGHQVFSLVSHESKNILFLTTPKTIIGKIELEGNNDWINHLPSDLDCVIHTAGIVLGFKSKDFYLKNSEITKKLIVVLKEKYKRLKFIYLSSIAAIGPAPTTTPLTEDALYCPVCQYGKSKQKAETYIKDIAPDLWEKIIINTAMVIGKGDKYIDPIIKMLYSKMVPLPGFSYKQKLYSFISIHDLVALVEKLLFYTPPTKNPESFIAANPQLCTYMDFFSNLLIAIKKRRQVQKVFFVPMPLCLVDVAILFSTIVNFFNSSWGNSMTPDKHHQLAHKYWIFSGKKSEQVLNFSYKWDLKHTMDDLAGELLLRWPSKKK